MRAASLTVGMVVLAFVVSGAAAADSNLSTALAYVDRECPKTTREISRQVWMTGWKFNALYGNCLAGDGRDQHIWFFSGGRYIGSDTHEPFSSREIIGLWRDVDTI